MRWQDFRRSDNVEEVEGGTPSGRGFGGFRLGGGAIVIVIVVSLLLGRNPLEMLALLSGGGDVPTQQQTERVAPPAPGQPQTARDEQREFVTRVLGDTEDVWGKIFQQSGRRYEPPKLDLFRGQIGSACGMASTAMGPFYCPGDQRVYLDLAFFQELSQRFGAPGDFARAYVIAHEVGHHVQNQLGIMKQVENRGGPGRGATSASVRLELQADCFAGVWGHSAAARGALDTRDIEQGLAAATAVGDDRLQRQTQGYVVPESFSHGSSAQRVKWFKTGLDSGDVARCDTFSARQL